MRSKAIALLVSAATFTVLTSAPSEAQQATGEPVGGAAALRAAPSAAKEAQIVR